MSTSVINTTVALMKRELWEHRSFWLVPTVMAGVLFAFYMYAIGYLLPTNVGLDVFVDRLSDSDPESLHKISKLAVPGVAAPFLVMMGFVIPFYLLDSLYAERRDRSILFWKSLPVTDASTVMSKWLSVFITFPACVLATVAVLSLAITLITGILVIFGGGNAWTLVWSHYSFFSGVFGVAVLILAQLLWYAPLLSWLMLASAWAKKAPFLWAALPPVAILVLEEMFFDTNRFIEMIGERLIPFGDTDDFERGSMIYGDHGRETVRLFGENVHVSGSFDVVTVDIFSNLLASPQLYTGLVFAAACTAGAIWLRRYRDES